MFSEFPCEIQLKIQNYVYELEISKKKEYFKQVHHELLYGWWYTELSNNTYHVSTQYCDKPTIITHLSLDEIYTLYRCQQLDWKPFLFYTLPFGKAPIFEYDMEYCFAERIPQLLSLTNETT